MKTILMVPIHLDALYLEHDQSLVTAMADFSRLPYSNGTRDINPDNANISATVVSQPFQNQNLYLKAGIYLHWSLPDALTKGTHNDKGMVYPRVPNRWLVTRNRNGQQEKQWIVESDYLFPYPNSGDTNIPGSKTAVCIPYNPEQAYKNKQPPFRYMGRKVPFTSPWREDSKAERVKKLTALGYEDDGFGYADPAFAAFFPNCHSVFGFCDGEYSDNLNELQYEIIGWYSDVSQDYLNTFIKQQSKGVTKEDLLATLKQEFQWITSDSNQAIPEQMLCYARLTFKPNSESTKNPALSDPNTIISIGNTGTEALSAYLATQINSTNKSTIENQLEAIQLSAQLEHRQLDIGSKFKEARHTKGFSAISGGILWNIRASSSSTDTVQATLPDSIADLLNTLNLKQQAYEQANQELESLRKQLFSDWYKYMICAYPSFGERADNYLDIDKVKYYIEQQDIASLQKKIAEVGELVWQKDASGNLIGASISPKSSHKSLAAQLVVIINSVSTAIKNHNQSAIENQIKYALQPTASMRYWQPNDPVVLLTGEAVKPTSRHGQDGLLECQICPLPSNKIFDHFQAIKTKINEIANNNHFAFTTWTQAPWHPFLLEWEVEVFPLKNHSNLNSPSRKYMSDFITSNYSLAETMVDLTIRNRQGGTISGANIYSGRCLLTPHASIQLQNQISAYLNSHQTNPSSNLIKTAKSAQKLLQALNCLSQSLGGFNEALLMHQQIQQINIAEPLGFDDYQSFTKTVSQLVNKSGISAPQPLNDFNPIRSGTMKILQLRLVDTFGQSKNLDCSHIITTEQMTNPMDNSLVWLPPRLVQPARLNFRWLSANSDDIEMNAHPATTPICGWILPNNLDGSLMIYETQGQALGLINQLAEWQPVPGNNTLMTVDSISNSHLKKVVNYLINQGQDFLAAFLPTLDRTLENIEPENFAQHQSLAFLVGRPIAVVRASLKFELQGLPAVNVGWNVFRQDMRRTTKEIDAFTSVQMPIRIGEYQQLNDGLVGYWKEQGEGYENNIFYAPQSDPMPNGNEKIKSHSADPFNIKQSLESSAQIVTMLIDPRGKIHATTGILPTKEINIPPDQYTAALQAINITFLTTPIVTSKQQLNLPLPTELGYKWSWVEKEQNKWSDTSQIAPINPSVVFSEPQEIREGWLQLSKVKEADKPKN